MCDNSKAVEDYSRVLAEKPKTIRDLQKRMKLLAPLSASIEEEPVETGTSENPIELISSEEEEDPEEYPAEDFEKVMSEKSESVDEEIEILEDEPIDEGNKVQEDNSLIEDSPESRVFFERFGNKKRKKNMIRSRLIRPRSCKKKEDYPFATELVPKPMRLGFEELEVASIPRRLRLELRRLA